MWCITETTDGRLRGVVLDELPEGVWRIEQAGEVLEFDLVHASVSDDGTSATIFSANYVARLTAIG